MKGYEHLTEAEARQLGRQPAKPKRTKYGAVKTTVDGLTFDSAKEARRYQELLNLAKAGEVRNVRVQPRFCLCALIVDGASLENVNIGTIANRRFPICEYVADFMYEQHDHGCGGVTWTRVVEDVKSPATRRKEVYRLKRKLFEAQYGITIRET